MTTMNKFRVLVWTFIIVVLLVAGGAYRMSSEANKKLERIFQVEIPFKDLVSEMEILREQSIASVLAYSRTREQKDRRFAEQSTAELERKMDSLWRKAPTEALREACSDYYEDRFGFPLSNTMITSGVSSLSAAIRR